jgi:hypothetical protein
LRSATSTSSFPADYVSLSRFEDSVLARALQIRSCSHHQLFASLPQHGRGTFHCASHTDPLWNEPPAGQSKATIHRAPLESIREPQPGHRLQIDVKFLERIAGSKRRLYSPLGITVTCALQSSWAPPRAAPSALNTESGVHKSPSKNLTNGSHRSSEPSGHAVFSRRGTEVAPLNRPGSLRNGLES